MKLKEITESEAFLWFLDKQYICEELTGQKS